VKQLSRFLFTAAILLVSLLIYNGQKGEDITRQGEHPNIEHIELQAEICITRFTSASVLSFWRNSGVIIEPPAGNLNDPEYLIRLKIQTQIHQELKPGLDFQSDPYLQHHSPYEDQLIA